MLKDKINRIYRKYHSTQYLQKDPLICVRRFKDRQQIEVVGFLASCLAYGRVDRIIYSIDSILKIAKNDLFTFTCGTSYSFKKKKLALFQHRFTKGEDVALCLESIKGALNDFGSLNKLFTHCYDKNSNSMKSVITLFSEKLREYGIKKSGQDTPSFRYLIPSPTSGSACKRLNMYFRWMIRREDGIDFGLWKDIPSSVLIIPLDVHIAKVAKYLSLCSRKSVDWKMAEQVTETLRGFDSTDPVKYDFSLCRFGMEKL